MGLFSESELKRIEAAVTAAEAGTSGEIVVHYTDRSAGYRWVPWAAGLVAAMVAGLAAWACEWREGWQLSAIHFLEVQALAAAAVFFLTSTRPVQRRLVSAKEKARRVHSASLAQFLASGVGATRDRTGILVFISEFEHRVEILADSGINKVCGADYWKSIVDAIVAGIHSGRAADAVCESVGLLGGKLSQHFPRRNDDQNELPNAPTSGKFDGDPKR